MSASQVFDDILQFNKFDSMVYSKLYKSDLIKNLRFNKNCVVLEDVEFLTKLMLSCTCACSSYVGYYYRKTPNSLIQQGLKIKTLIGSIASHNSCIEILKDTKMRERSYQFKFYSLFNWLIRTADYDDWKSFYRIIKKEAKSDFGYIIKNSFLRLKSKILLLNCAISINVAHTCAIAINALNKKFSKK